MMSYGTPSPEEQIRFLDNVQRVISEGDKSSTLKFALLMALADVAVEKGDDSGAAMVVRIDDLAVKFIQYYGPQVRPFQSVNGKTGILKQNTGKQAEILNLLSSESVVTPKDLRKLQADEANWNRIRRKVKNNIVKMPLWKLQTINRRKDPFLYAIPENEGVTDRISLFPGVAFCLRKFHELMLELIQGAWVNYVRRIGTNKEIIGEPQDLHSFLFGSERTVFTNLAPFILKIQDGRCFYCSETIPQRGVLDHFVPWSRYQFDLAHNFVAADPKCNSKKSDHLASPRYLDRWLLRNQKCRDRMLEHFDKVGLYADEIASMNIVSWAYDQGERRSVPMWDGGKNLIAFDRMWRSRFEPKDSAVFLKAAEEKFPFGSC